MLPRRRGWLPPAAELEAAAVVAAAYQLLTSKHYEEAARRPRNLTRGWRRPATTSTALHLCACLRATWLPGAGGEYRRDGCLSSRRLAAATAARWRQRTRWHLTGWRLAHASIIAGLTSLSLAACRLAISSCTALRHPREASRNRGGLFALFTKACAEAASCYAFCGAYCSSAARINLRTRRYA